MSRKRKHKHRPLFQMRPIPGHDAEAPPPHLHVLAYSADELEEHSLTELTAVSQLLKKWPVLWLSVTGSTDRQLLKQLGDIFGLHELALEDVMHRHQRAKVEPYGGQLFMTLPGVSVDALGVHCEQFSAFLGHRFVISIQSNPAIIPLQTVRERITAAASPLRQAGADRVFYALIDKLIDGYFPVVEGLGESIETLEDAILDRSTPDCPAHLHDLKRDVLHIRRAIWPARDALNVLLRDDMASLITAQTRFYLRDCYDHTVRIMDFVETQREMCSDLMDLYLSVVSNRMNEIIKILTIVTLVFMPPTLVAGIYGMNFKIPEYKWDFGYIYALGLMMVTAVVVWFWALRSGWLSQQKSGR